MAVCLRYQAVYVRRERDAVSKKAHLVLASLLLVVLSARVWMKLEATDLGYQFARERQKTVALDMERREMELQLSVLNRPDALAKTAVEHLHLSERRSDQVIRVSY